MSLQSKLEDKCIGCLLGGAIGDALGAPVEFMSLQEIRAKFGNTGISDFYPAYGKLGAITDDTQMTLFTAEGLLRGFVQRQAKGIGGAEVAIVHHAYLRWLKTQQSTFSDKEDNHDGWLIQQEGLWSRRAPGSTCIGALNSASVIGEAAANNSKGCGTVMRVAPIGLMYDGEQAYQLGKMTSELTHGHPTASTSAGALSVIISHLKDETQLEQAVISALEIVVKDETDLGIPAETSQAIESALALAKSGATPTPEIIESLGAAWIAEEALAISIYCALVARDFADGVLLAVNHSGDSDSTGAITGNILGLIYGQDQLPQKWREAVELNELITQIAIDLIDVPNYYCPEDTPCSTDDNKREYYDVIFDRYPES
jgi:ADP-ribosylglycohydrolase